MSVVQLPPRGVAGTALAARDAVQALASCDLTGLSGAEAVDLLATVRPMLAQLESVAVTAAHVVKESGVWGLDGSRSAKAFLERATGAPGAKISTHLKLADRLTTVLPLTAHALREGSITVDHALVLSRGACGSPARDRGVGRPGPG